MDKKYIQDWHEIVKDEKFPKLANSLKEVQKLPEWATVEKVMQDYVAAADAPAEK